MAFCSFSSESIIKNKISIDNSFIVEFLPIAPEHCVKVYLFGLYNCHNVNLQENSLESFARVLNLSEEDIVSAFTYWQEMGLVNVLNVNPIQIKYLPVSKGSSHLMKFNKDKYSNFNAVVEELLKGRIVSQTEFHEYYYTMESLHIEPSAMELIVKYCTEIKGNNVGYKYILTVAKNWAYEGIRTLEKVQERLQIQKAIDSEVSQVLKAMGIKKSATVEEYQMYLVWTDQLGFELPTLTYLAKTVKEKKGNISRLDSLIEKFYKMRLLSVKEIEEYLIKEKEYYEIAKQVSRNIGVRYENLEVVVDTYISNWTNLGFDTETLNVISKHCFFVNIRTLSGLDEKIKQFYKMGLISIDDIASHLENIEKTDKIIKEILAKLGIDRSVNMYDRSYYNTWVYEWETPKEVLDHAISESINKISAITYLNKLLGLYHSKNIKTVELAKQEKVTFGATYENVSTKKKINKRAEKVEYSTEQLNSLLTSMEEIEI